MSPAVLPEGIPPFGDKHLLAWAPASRRARRHRDERYRYWPGSGGLTAWERTGKRSQRTAITGVEAERKQRVRARPRGWGGTGATAHPQLTVEAEPAGRGRLVPAEGIGLQGCRGGVQEAGRRRRPRVGWGWGRAPARVTWEPRVGPHPHVPASQVRGGTDRWVWRRRTELDSGARPLCPKPPRAGPRPERSANDSLKPSLTPGPAGAVGC